MFGIVVLSSISRVDHRLRMRKKKIVQLIANEKRCREEDVKSLASFLLIYLCIY